MADATRADESNYLTGQHFLVDNGMCNVLPIDKVQLDPPTAAAPTTKAKL